MVEFDYSLDLILKNDEWCRTFTGNEFIFSSNLILLDFLIEHYAGKSFRTASQMINGRYYLGFQHNSTKEKFIISLHEEEEIKNDDPLVLAMRNISFLNIVCAHIHSPEHITRDGLRLAAQAWNRNS